MLDIQIVTDKDGEQILETSISGKALLSISQLNKSTAFTDQERIDFGLIGKLPDEVETLEDQIKRCYAQYIGFDKQINRNIYLNNLLNANQVLFYRLVQEHLEEMVPTIYTPIVGEAVREFNRKYMQPRGLYISYQNRDRIEEILNNRSNAHIELIVVSDGEGILGIGDQGICGMAIPVAKLMVYTAFAGVNPMHTLPILLDAGTNNEELLNDPLYLGWRHPRVSGKEYDEFIEKFITAIKKVSKTVFLHWEDFGRNNAQKNLDNYRQRICSFNDDIQGTGVVAVAALLAALRRTKQPAKDQRIVIFGAGTAGMGITQNIEKMLLRFGLNEEMARDCFWLIDKEGLIIEGNTLTTAQKDYARTQKEVADLGLNLSQPIDLLSVVSTVKPTILVGCSTMKGAFTQAIIEEMAKHVEHPIIFSLSNPTEKAEATPEDLIRWTNNKALIATGSPFEPVVFNQETISISQCNNYLAFPGLGLGVIAVEATSVSDEMLWAASEALSHFTENKAGNTGLLPTIEDAKQASRLVAIAVAEQAVREGLTAGRHLEEVPDLVNAKMWEPHYLPYRRKG